jgi:cysteine-rich repeat protein
MQQLESVEGRAVSPLEVASRRGGRPAVALAAALALALGLAAPATAQVELYVDTAPNVFGSPDYPGWWQAARDDVVAGTFSDMRRGAFAGRREVTPREEIVYSTGDRGQRLHWIYWIEGWDPPRDPDTGALDLQGRLEVKYVVDWAGQDWTRDSDDPVLLVEDDPLAGWAVPLSVERVEQGDALGVIGTFGFAWWAWDDLAEPLDTNGNPFDETDEDDIEALVVLILAAQTRAVGLVRYVDDEGVEHLFELTVTLPTCGDGLVNGDEVCDDGDDNGTYGFCDALCEALGPHCGDGTVDEPEECDDGNLLPGDGCNELCLLEPEPGGDDVGPDLDAGDDVLDTGDEPDTDAALDVADEPDVTPDGMPDLPGDAEDGADADTAGADVPLTPDGDGEDEEPVRPAREADGCGCRAVDARPADAVPFLALLLLLRRRRASR